jgi:hypothetical protein
MLNFYGEACYPNAQLPSWRATPCRLTLATYSVYSQLPSIAEGRPSIRYPRTRHAQVTRGPPNMACENIEFPIYTSVFPELQSPFAKGRR